jgi:diguanylate cyclase (GGDEF)-like protein
LINQLREFRSIAIALITADGHLIDANEGFLLLLSKDVQTQITPNIRTLFIKPTFNELITFTEKNTRIIQNLFTMGDRYGKSYTLKGKIIRDQDNAWMFVGEHDIAELAFIQEQLICLNRELAENRRDLALTNNQLLANAELITRLSLTDPLTGLGNRRRFNEGLRTEMAAALRHGTPLSLVMCDLDHFKRINDDFGHNEGDNVLMAFSGLIIKNIRANDLATRFGGEEFLIVMPKSNKTSAAEVANRIRCAIESSLFQNINRPVTASFGIAEWNEGETSDQLLKKVDIALYAAKTSGRNRVEIAEQTNLVGTVLISLSEVSK